jgi:hypothetical protein
MIFQYIHNNVYTKDEQKIPYQALSLFERTFD